MRISAAAKRVSLVRSIPPGETVMVEWKSIAPQQTTPTPPQQLTAEQKEAQAWDKVRASTDPDQLEAFLRDYANGAHAQEAHSRLDEAVWARTAQGDPRALQAYAIRFPKGAHLRDVQRILDDASWAAVNKSNAQAVQAFLSQSATSGHRGEAQTILDQLNKQRQAEEQKKQPQATQPQPQPNQPQQPPSLSTADRTAVRAAIQRFNDAFVHKSA